MRDFVCVIDTENHYSFDPNENFYPNSSCSRWLSDSWEGWVLKMVKIKRYSLLKNLMLNQNFSQMHHIDFIHTLCQCSFLCLEPGLHVCGADQAEQQWRHWQQSMDKINMVHPRKISLAEIWGSIRFFISKIFFVFHFDHF